MNTSTHEKEPHKQAYSILKQLVSDPRNTVCVLSDRTRHELELLLGDIDGLSLAAENGCFVQQCHSKGWKPLITLENLSWRDDIDEIFQFYTDRTPGSRIEKKDIRMVWDYHKAGNQDFGRRQALECQSHINDSLGTTYPIHAIATHKAVEIIPRAANKAAIVYHIIERPPMETSDDQPFDYVMYFGAGRLDEDIFTVLQRLAASPAPTSLPTYISSMPPSSSEDDDQQLEAWHHHHSEYVHSTSLPSHPRWENITATHVDPQFHLLAISVSNKSVNAKFFIPGVKAVLDTLKKFIDNSSAPLDQGGD